MSSNILLTLSYGILFAVWGLSYFYAMPVSLNLITMSTLIIYIGSHRSLRLLLSEAEGGISSKEKEVISTNDAYRFPIVGSAALFGLYVRTTSFIDLYSFFVDL